MGGGGMRKGGKWEGYSYGCTGLKGNSWVEGGSVCSGFGLAGKGWMFPTKSSLSLMMEVQEDSREKTSANSRTTEGFSILGLSKIVVISMPENHGQSMRNQDHSPSMQFNGWHDEGSPTNPAKNPIKRRHMDRTVVNFADDTIIKLANENKIGLGKRVTAEEGRPNV
ncbi:hypothetical protein Tco_0558698 [Tanacetum coccineum]